MKLLSIEPTPNPNSMKLNLDEKLPKGVSHTFRAGQESVPPYAERLLTITGVHSLYHAADFISLQRNPGADWQAILAQTRQAFDDTLSDSEATAQQEQAGKEKREEGSVHIQFFRRIPMLVKVNSSRREVRKALPVRFGEALQEATPSSPNMLRERIWKKQGDRYGELEDIVEEVVDEIDAAYDEQRLRDLVQQAFDYSEERPEVRPRLSRAELLEMLHAEDWRVRFSALEQIGVNADYLQELIAAMEDPQFSVRRLALILAGLTKDPRVSPALLKTLEDPKPILRRIAADALNDLGDPKSQAALARKLQDPSPLVRWRAARFLFELGDHSVLSSLQAAQKEPVFEIRMQILQAIERIQQGEDAKGPIWQQMTRMNQEKRE